VTQCFEETRAELNVEFQNGHRWRAEVGEICRKNNQRCSQLEELTQRLETHIAEHNLKLDQHSNLLKFETSRDQFESRLTSERKICQELFEVGVKSSASELQNLRDTCDARIKDLTSLLDAEYADRKEKQEKQNQVENLCRTLTTTLAEEKSSLIETESVLLVLMAVSSDRESMKRCMQIDNLERRVKAEIETCADIIQEHETRLEAVSNTCGSNSARIEESLWNLQRKSCPNVLESDDGVDGECPKILTTVHDLVVGFGNQHVPKMPSVDMVFCRDIFGYFRTRSFKGVCPFQRTLVFPPLLLTTLFFNPGTIWVSCAHVHSDRL